MLELTQRVEIEINNRVQNENQLRVVVEENNRFKQLGGQQRLV